MNAATSSPITPPTLQPYMADPATTIWQSKPAPEVESLRHLYLSPSSVKKYLACPLQYFYAKIVGLPEPTSVALHIGKAIHTTLQAFNNARWRGADSSEEAMQEAFSKHFLRLEQEEGPVDYADEEARTKARETAWNTVRAYFSSPEAAKDTEMLQGVEVSVSAYIPGLPVPVMGIIDLVQHDLKVVDYKSAAAKPNAEQVAFEHELQLVSYQLMVEQATGKTPPALENGSAGLWTCSRSPTRASPTSGSTLSPGSNALGVRSERSAPAGAGDGAALPPHQKLADFGGFFLALPETQLFSPPRGEGFT